MKLSQCLQGLMTEETKGSLVQRDIDWKKHMLDLSPTVYGKTYPKATLKSCPQFIDKKMIILNAKNALLT